MRWFRLTKDQRKQYDSFLKTLESLTDAEKSPKYAYIVKDPDRQILFATNGVSLAWWMLPAELQPLFEGLVCLSYAKGCVLENEPPGAPPVLDEVRDKHWKDDGWVHLNHVPASKKSLWAGLMVSAYALGGNLINSECMESLNPVASMMESMRSVQGQPVQSCNSDGSFCVMIMPMGNVEPYRKEK